MSTQALTYLFVGLTFSLYIGIAIWSKAKSTNDFYVAGKGVNPIANGMATAADWMSAASFLSMAGLIAFMGRDGSVYLMGWTGGLCPFSFVISSIFKKVWSIHCSRFHRDSILFKHCTIGWCTLLDSYFIYLYRGSNARRWYCFFKIS